jgi:NlpC/P60 family
MQYNTIADLNLYSSTAFNSLVTQGAIGRFVTIEGSDEGSEFGPEGILPPSAPLRVMLVEDSYPGWLDPQDWPKLVPASHPYVAPQPTFTEIQASLPAVIAFTQSAMAIPNTYLWGGTVAPNYDCSGLMQAAFRSVGIQLPRDAYQQEAFLAPIAPTLEALQPGDLIFFGTPKKATHVGLYLSHGEYIHSSGQAHGRNGIGIDRLLYDHPEESHPVSGHYFERLRGAGRVVKSYLPTA